MMGVRGALAGTVPGAQEPSGLPGEACPLSHGEQSLGWLGAPSQCLTAGRSESQHRPPAASRVHPAAWGGFYLSATELRRH